MINNEVDRRYMQPYELLAMAIVERACKDYINAYRIYLRENNKHNARKVRELELFFRGEWYRELCATDPNWLIENLKKTARWEKVKMRQYRYEIRYDGKIKRGRVAAKNMDEAYATARRYGCKLTGYGETGFLEGVTVIPIKEKDDVHER